MDVTELGMVMLVKLLQLLNIYKKKTWTIYFVYVL